MAFVETQDGTQIFYNEWGPKDAQPVVFSHGWPLQGDAFEDQMMFLAQHGYRVIAHDRRGHGRSSQPGFGNDMDHYADDLAAVTAKLNLRNAVHVGHSTGGGEVARYVGRHGVGRVAKVVLIGAVTPIMVKGANDPYQKYRVLYRTSTKVTNGGVVSELPLIASGQVWVPPVASTTFPSGAQPVLANTHGAIGVQAQCAPSRGRYTDSQAAMRDLSTGTWANAVVTVPDYVGLGVDHGYRVPDANARDPFNHTYLDRVTHPFVSIESEGRATIDLVRSAKEIPGAYVTDTSKWLVAGVSQGGHAALATAEVWSRDDYNKAGPKLKGAIAGAPASELQNPSWWPAEAKDSVFAMLAAGITLENRDIFASNLFNDVAKMAFGATTNVSCFNNAQSLLTWWTAYKFSGNSIFNQSIDAIFNNATYKSLLTKNSPGNLSIPLKVPVFIGTLRGDPMVREERVRAAVALYQSKPTNNVTFCYYSPVVNGGNNIANANNHDAFRRMFPQKNANGTWVDQPQTPACVGTNTGSNVVTPVQWASTL